MEDVKDTYTINHVENAESMLIPLFFSLLSWCFGWKILWLGDKSGMGWDGMRREEHADW